MDLSTRYLGFELESPFVVGASPLADDLDGVRRLEDAGASAIVLRSLFEEHIAPRPPRPAALRRGPRVIAPAPELPEPPEFRLGPDEYLEHLHEVKRAVAIPVVASLNGATLGGWLHHAQLVEQAGADAVELNAYRMVTDPDVASREIEEGLVEMVAAVADALLVPVAVKLSPHYSALPHLARQLDRAGAAGLVLFNRFYQADVDLEGFTAAPVLHLSSSDELLLRLRWIAVLRGAVEGSLAATGGIHGALDVLKAVACGADAVQCVSELLRRGPERLAEMRDAVVRWLVEHDLDSLSELQGSLSLERCPDPTAYERVEYLNVLSSWPRRG
ncbi:MAG: dihydroorotate dehydrogenase-like protein [Acidobacteria bacterium]|nr:dihydroorotate dehydrogenase-like protein [Acidobacteriota bacterium]